MRRPFTVLALTPSVGGFYFGAVLLSLRREVRAAGGRLLIVQTPPSPDGELSDYDLPIAWDAVDGIVSLTCAAGAGHLARARQAGKWVVLVSNSFPFLDVPDVRPDNCRGIRAAVEHLIEHGHRRIGFAGNLAQADVVERLAEYQRVLAAHGIPAAAPDVVALPDNDPGGGEVGARAELARAQRPTAYVLATDRNAIGFLRVLAAAGVRVPEDVAVVGFDNIDAGAFTDPPLTSAGQSFADVGARAGRMVCALIAGDGPAEQPGPSSSLVVRQSCGCADDGGPSDADSWRRRAGDFLREAEQIQTALEEQYRVDAGMIAGRDDPRRLHWLAGTHVRSALFAAWAGEPGGELVVHGTFGAEGAEIGDRLAVADFPPGPLIDEADADPADHRRTCLVVPVADGQRDWGLLAIVGRIDTSSTLETYQRWATQLAATLHERQLQAAVRSSEERYALAAQATNDGLWELDFATGAFYVSERGVELAGLQDCPAERRFEQWLSRIHPADDTGARDAMRAALAAGAGTASTEYRLRQADGTYRWVLSRAVAVQNPDGTPARIVGSLTDVHDQRQLEDRLRATALEDALTGLPNRRLFVQRLEHARQLARRDHVPFAVVFLDLDRFKSINDSLGHLVGDRLLVEVARGMTASMRAVDTVARFGGDEFAVLLHGIGRNGVLDVVDRVQRAIADPMHLDGHDLVITATAGVATDEGSHGSAEEMLRDADIAMYHAKSVERGSVAFFDEAMHADAVRRLQLTGELRTALAEQQFEVHYQPIVDLRTGRGNRFEALLRWRHPERGLVGPDQFLPLLLETGMIVAVGHWLVGEVCRQLAEWRDAVANVAINLSDREFWQADLLEHLTRCLHRHGIDAGRLTLEITEGVVMHQPDTAQQLMAALHRTGFDLHVDDFGTGTSSLDSLHRFQVDALKIDRSFVARVGGGTRSEELIRAIVAMAAALGLDVVAEGVETEEQVQFLLRTGCRSAQGWLFGRPMPAADVADWLRQPVRSLPRPA